jgi:nitrate reductase (cytochrome)
MSINRRKFLELSAAASALGAIGTQVPLAQAFSAQGGGSTNWVKSVCRYCGTGCGLFIGVQDGKVVSVRGDKENHNRGLLCLKGAVLPQIMQAPDRLLHPMVRKSGKLVQVSWDEAMDVVAGKFKESISKFGPESVAFYGSGQGLTEETYVANKLFKAGIRTNNVEGNPRLCMASAVAGYMSTYGKDEPMGTYDDIDAADVFLVVGSNMAEAHPIIHQRVVRRKESNPDVKIIVMDPRRTPTSRIADLHIAFVPGADLAVLNSMAHVMVAERMIDEEFIKAHLVFGEGTDANRTWLDYQAFLADYSPGKVAAAAGCKAEDIVTAARWFGAKGKSVTSLWCMGLNQRTKGVWANNLVHNLHLITGKIGTPGSTPFSLTGQPNACGGVRDGGALSHLLPYGRLVANDGHRAEMEKLWGVPAGTLQPKPGLPTIDMFRAIEEGKVKVLYVMCTNPGQSLPNVNRYRAALQNTFLVVAEAYHPTRTSELADVVLPAALWAEKEGVYGCSERRYQLLEQAVKPSGESRPDFEILCDLGRRLGHGALLPFKTPDDVWTEILTCAKGTVYDFSAMTRARLKESHGLIWPMPTPDRQVKLRYVKGEDPFVPADHPSRMKFYGRPDGRAVVWARPQKPPEEVIDAEYPFYLTTGRILEHWHTGTMTRHAKELRNTNYETMAEFHPADAQRLALKPADSVRLTSRRGNQVFRVKITEDSREGMVYLHMHDPDRMCNVLTNDVVDPVSRQPEFKICAIKVQKVRTT